MERADKTFKNIRYRLFSPPIISFLDFSQLFTLTTNASDMVCEAILMQEADNEKKS